MRRRVSFWAMRTVYDAVPSMVAVIAGVYLASAISMAFELDWAVFGLPIERVLVVCITALLLLLLIANRLGLFAVIQTRRAELDRFRHWQDEEDARDP